MFDVKQYICYPGHTERANEDAVGYGRDYCFVMDGASCLSGTNVVDPKSDAAWMTGKVRDGLCQLLDAEDPRPTDELLRQVMAQVREEYVQALRAKGIDAPEDSPSAGFALFRQRNGKLEFFGLGDCVGIAQFADGRVFCWQDNGLAALDHQVTEEMTRLHESTGISVREAKEACGDMLIRNRNRRNQPGGYWILDLLTDDGIDNACTAEWDLTKPVRVGAFSDGFAQLVEVFGQYPDCAALFEGVQQGDLNEMFRRLCAMQDADPEYNEYPRFKHRDDTSALWGVFHPEK